MPKSMPKLQAHTSSLGESVVSLFGENWTLRDMVSLFIAAQGEFEATHYQFIDDALSQMSDYELGRLLLKTRKRYTTLSAAIAHWYPKHYQLVDMIADSLIERYGFSRNTSKLAALLPQMAKEFHII